MKIRLLKPILQLPGRFVFFLSLLTLVGAKIEAVQVVQSHNITQVVLDAKTTINPGFGGVDSVFYYVQTLNFLDHGQLMHASKTYSFPSYSFLMGANGSAGTLTKIGLRGQIEAMTSGLTLRAIISASEEDNAQMNVQGTVFAKNSVSLTFDEPVNIRVAYVSRFPGGDEVSVQGQHWREDYGVLNFVASSFNATAQRGVGGYLSVAGPGSDFLIESPATTTITWAVSPLDEEPVLPGKNPAVPIFLPMNPRPNPAGGFDPIPIGTKDMLTSSTELSFIGISTKSISDFFEDIIFESFEVTSVENPLTSLLVNDLPAGSDLTVTVGGETHDIVAGEPIDFGPEGVESFVIAGLDPAYASVERDALVLGLGFAETGLGRIEVIPMNTHDAADANLDGTVDAADYVIWAKHRGITSAARHTQGDVNGDGAVNDSDYNFWRTNFGKGNHTEVEAVNVPEPASWLLAALFMFAGANNRFWRKSVTSAS